MRTRVSRPARRWLALLAIVLVVAGTGLVVTTATADRKLPPRTAEQLLVDLAQARVDGMSGTVVQRSDLGIPEVPGADDGSLLALLSGNHTLRIWYAAPDKSRLALLNPLGETDLIRNGRDVWLWSSEQNKAVHRMLAPGDKPDPQGRPGDPPATPEEAAAKVLATIGPTTVVSADSDVTVAGRDAYELVLQPKDTRSLITSARLALDGEHKVPLRVRVYAAGDKPVFEVSFTSVDFTRPDDAQFDFNPPPGAEVEEIRPRSGAETQPPTDGAADKPTVVGEGWTTVVIHTLGAGAAGQAGDEVAGLLQQLPRVSGTWGAGRLLAGTAFSLVLTDDGRLAVGAVEPELLYQALAR